MCFILGTCIHVVLFYGSPKYGFILFTLLKRIALDGFQRERRSIFIGGRLHQKIVSLYPKALLIHQIHQREHLAQTYIEYKHDLNDQKAKAFMKRSVFLFISIFTLT